MKDYVVSLPEQKGWGISSTLQAALRSRGIDVNQAEIASYFDSELNKNSMEKFLRSFGLNCVFRNPHESLAFYEDVDIFLRDAFTKGDIFLFYDLSGLQKGREKVLDHTSLVKDFDFNSKTVTLADFVFSLNKRSFPLIHFIRGMSPLENENYGFYTINN